MLLADSDINDNEAISLFPGTTRITDRTEQGEVVRDVDLSNIPERNNDNTMNAVLGFRWAPTEHLGFMLNGLIPLNDGGLRSDVVATMGVSAQY